MWFITNPMDLIARTIRNASRIGAARAGRGGGGAGEESFPGRTREFALPVQSILVRFWISFSYVGMVFATLFFLRHFLRHFCREILSFRVCCRGSL